MISIYGYIGFDCTASSLHDGRLSANNDLEIDAESTATEPIDLTRRAAQHLIGDPSGKDTARKIFSAKQIKNNLLNSIKKSF